MVRKNLVKQKREHEKEEEERAFQRKTRKSRLGTRRYGGLEGLEAVLDKYSKEQWDDFLGLD